MQEHYVLLLGAAIFLELAGSVLFIANYSAGAYMLVCCCGPYACFFLLHLMLFSLGLFTSTSTSFTGHRSYSISCCVAQLLFTASVTPVIHNWWDIKDQNAQLVELIMFFKVTPLALHWHPGVIMSCSSLPCHGCKVMICRKSADVCLQQ